MYSSAPPNGVANPEANPQPQPAERRGVALITALFAIVVLAIIISGVFFTSQQEYRGTRNALVEQRAFAISEFGLNSEISNWDRSRNLPGSSFGVGAIDNNQVYVAEGDTAWVSVTRLSDNGFWVVSEGKAHMGKVKLESRRQTSAYVRIAYPSITPKGAITAAGNVTLQGSAFVDGDNNDPTGWAQCSSISGSTVPAVTVPPGNTVNRGRVRLVVSRHETAHPAEGRCLFSTKSVDFALPLGSSADQKQDWPDNFSPIIWGPRPLYP